MRTAQLVIDTIPFAKPPAAMHGGTMLPVRFAQDPNLWLHHRLLEHLRTPGTYIARVHTAPAGDDLGLRVEWSDRAHVVVGILDPKDFVR